MGLRPCFTIRIKHFAVRNMSIGKCNFTACCFKKVFSCILLGVLFVTFFVFRNSFVGIVHPSRVTQLGNVHRIVTPDLNGLLDRNGENDDETEEYINGQANTFDEVRHPGFNVSYLGNQCMANSIRFANENFDLRVFVFTYNRAASVQRLLSSLNNAIYGNNSVILEVWIDRSVDGTVDKDTLHVVRGFKFDPGIFRVCVHSTHVGILGQWLIPWKPKIGSHEIAVLLEDDMTVSPYFYKYLKLVHSKYRNIPKLNGFALQGVSMKHSGENGMVEIPPTNKVYLYPTLGTWGFSPNAESWIHFLRWFKKTYPNMGFVPTVPDHVGTGWYLEFVQGKKEDGFWEMWHIYHSWSQKEWTLYPNFADHKGLTFNWKENGLHYQGNSVTGKDEDKKDLLLDWKPEFENLPAQPVYVDNGGHILPRT